jgi:hypothetical protein
MSHVMGTAKVEDSLFAICGVGLALVVALALVPDDYRPAGALFNSAIALTIGLFAGPALKITVGGYRDALRTEHFLVLALVYFILLDLLQTTYPLTLVSKEDVETAFIAIALFAVGIWIGVALPALKLPAILIRVSRQEFEPQQIYKAIWACFLLSTFYYGYMAGFDPETIFNSLTAERWGAVWRRGTLGDWRSFIEHLQYCGYVLPSLTVMLADRAKSNWLNPRVFTGIFLSCVFLAFQIQGGGRRIVGVILGAAILTWLLLNKRISVVRAGVVLLLVWGMLILLQNILYIRRFGFENYIEHGIAKSSRKDYFAVDDNFLRLAQIIHFFPSAVDYVGSEQMIFTLIRPVPRALWPSKPTDPGFDLPKLVGIRGASLSSSIVGELYASWGLMAVLLGGVVLGGLAKSWNTVGAIGSNNGRVLYALGIMVLFSGVRSMQDLVIMSYTIVAWTFISVIVARRRSNIPYARPP